MTIRNTIPVSLCLLFPVAAMAADNTAPVMIDASDCIELNRPIERLTCFEDRVEAAKQAPASRPPRTDLPVVSIPRNTASQPQQAQPEPAPDPQTATNTGNSVEDDFGILDNTDNRKDRGQELVARITGIKELNPNRHIITLENGQVWEQTATKRFALATGDEVRIYPSRWGNSYRLGSMSHNGFIQVRRLR